MTKSEFNLGNDDVKDYCRMTKRFFAELLGTFIYITLLLSGKVIIELSPFTNGLLVASILVWIRPVSGGHINPAITLGSLICNYIGLLPAILYIISQTLGALLGALTASAIASNGLQPRNAQLTSLFVLEMLKTFLVVGVALSVSNTLTAMRIGPVAIGLCIIACLTTTIDYRALMNPVASLAVAIFHEDFSNHWVFWAAPLLGGTLAGLVHRFLLQVKHPDKPVPHSRPTKPTKP